VLIALPAYCGVGLAWLADGAVVLELVVTAEEIPILVEESKLVDYIYNTLM
jgi:hypothetical protein